MVWSAIVLRALSAGTVYSLLCVRDDALMCTSVRAVPAALPQGPSLRSGLCCPGPSSLNRPIRPTRGHIPTSQTRGLYEMPSLCLFTLGPLGNPRLHPPCPFRLTCKKLLGEKEDGEISHQLEDRLAGADTQGEPEAQLHHGRAGNLQRT